MACSARTSKVHEGILYENEIKRLNFVVQLQINIMWTGYTKTYVWLSRTGKNLVRICKPLTWLVHRTSTFLIRKIKETKKKSSSNYSSIKIHLKNLILDKIRFKIVFLLTSPFHSHFINFVFTSSILGLSQKQFTRVIMWFKTLNARLFLSFKLNL